MAAQSRTRDRNSWIALRQPLLLACFFGTAVSLTASGRVSLRLVLDGALSFAFVPIIEVAVFALVYRRGARTLPFAAALDRFFAGNAPWLVALTWVAAIAVVDTPQQTMRWTTFPRLEILLAAALGTAVWSAYLDVRFFRNVSTHSKPSPLTDAVLFRAIAWPLGAVYFFGYAIWPMLVEWGIRL